jgi:regulator of replication initiation timing
MQNIGFVEKADANNSDTIKFLVDSAKGINTEINKEVSPMTDATNEVVAEATEEVVEAPAVEESQVAPEAEAAPAEDVAVEKSTDVDKNDMPGTGVQEDSDDEDEEDEMESKEPVMDATKSEVVNKSDELLNESIIEIKETVSKAFSDLSETVKSLYEHVSELSKSLTAVKDEVTATKGEFDNFGKRIDAVAADTAFRKSGDLGEIVQELPEMKVQKSLWDGRFLTNTDLYN